VSGVDLVTFLRARLDEDERVARAAIGGPWEVGPTFGARDNRVYVRAEGDLIDSVGTCVIAGQIPNVPEWRSNAQHIARHDPARVLREVEAKRRRMERHERLTAFGQPDRCRWCGRDTFVPWPCPDIQGDLAVYADRPGYRDEWRPT
jgi:hypothetical protein